MEMLIKLLMVDARTLAFVSCLGGFIMAATMLGLHIGGSRHSGVAEWALGGLVFGLGYLVGHLLLTLDLTVPGWIATAIANNLIAAGHVLVLMGVRRYLGRDRWVWLLVLPLAAALSVSVPTLRSFPIPFYVDTVLLVSVDLYAAFLLWRARAPGITAYRRAVACVLLLFGLFVASRTAYLMATRAFSGSFDAHTFQVLVFLVGMLFGFVLTMSLVLMIFREKELRMREIARRDALTGLHNRYALQERSGREIEIARRYDTAITLIAMDLDHFKAINDRFGHAGGDRVLRGVAEVLTSTLRESDTVFRIGGEEFLLLLPMTDEKNGRIAAERLRRLIESASWPFGTETLSATASLGIARVYPQLESFDQAMVRADNALYSAKLNGRNRVEVAPAPDPNLANNNDHCPVRT